MNEMSLFTKKGFLHGGARPGAGRKKGPREPLKVLSLRVTDEEAKLLREYLMQLRSEKIMFNVGSPKCDSP